MQGKEVMQICSKIVFLFLLLLYNVKSLWVWFFCCVFFFPGFFFWLLYSGCSGIIVLFKCTFNCLFKSKLVGSSFSFTASGM